MIEESEPMTGEPDNTIIEFLVNLEPNCLNGIKVKIQSKYGPKISRVRRIGSSGVDRRCGCTTVRTTTVDDPVYGLLELHLSACPQGDTHSFVHMFIV